MFICISLQKQISLMYIAVDFDGTIVEHAYPKIGPEIPFAIDTLKLIQSELHHNIILWTVREGRLLDEAVQFCRERGLEFYAVNRNHPGSDMTLAPRKLMVDMFIDDRNFGGLPDWGLMFKTLKDNPDASFSAAGFSHNATKAKKSKGPFGRKR